MFRFYCYCRILESLEQISAQDAKDFVRKTIVSMANRSVCRWDGKWLLCCLRKKWRKNSLFVCECPSIRVIICQVCIWACLLPQSLMNAVPAHKECPMPFISEVCSIPDRAEQSPDLAPNKRQPSNFVKSFTTFFLLPATCVPVKYLISFSLNDSLKVYGESRDSTAKPRQRVEQLFTITAKRICF